MNNQTEIEKLICQINETINAAFPGYGCLSSGMPETMMENIRWWMAINEDTPVIVTILPEARPAFSRIEESFEAEAQGSIPIFMQLFDSAKQMAFEAALLYACSKCREKPIVDIEAANWACQTITWLLQTASRAPQSWLPAEPVALMSALITQKILTTQKIRIT